MGVFGFGKQDWGYFGDLAEESCDNAAQVRFGFKARLDQK